MVKLTLMKKGLPKNMMRLWRTIMKDELAKILIAWRENTLPKHFKTGAGQIYKYHRRKPAYRMKKRGLNLPPLIYSGRSRRKMIADRRRPSGSSKRATLRLKAESFWNLRRKAFPARGKTLAHEITKVTQKEADNMLKVLLAKVSHRINENRHFEKTLLR